MNPLWVVLSTFLFAIPLGSALALPACPDQRFYLKSGEALEIEFNRRPGCDVRFFAVERGTVERKLFYPSGKTDERRLSARERDIPEAWSELPQKAYLKASSESVVKFLAQSPPVTPQEKPPQKQREPTAPLEVCPDNFFKLSPGEELLVRWGNRPDCRVGWTNYKGTVEEFITYPSGRTQTRIVSPASGEFRYRETPLSIRIKAIGPAEVRYFEKKPMPVQTPAPRMVQQPQAPRPAPPQFKFQTQPASQTSENVLSQIIIILLAVGFIIFVILLSRSSSIFVLGHWSKLIENLQASTQEFYGSVENAIATRKVPAISNSRIDWKEGGLFTAYREYLRISREKEVIDICGAPCGTGFFVSWWHGELRPSPIGPALATIGLVYALDVGITLVLPQYFGMLVRLMVLATVLLLIFLFVGILINRSAGENWVRYVLVIPVIGWLMDRLFLPPTFYRIDSASMFRAAIEQSVHEVVDQMTQAKGLRALTELERRPILRDFFQRLR
jgi:hypothetical protein